MDDQLPIIIIGRFNGVLLESCHGPIPDVCRELWFSPLVEPKLPDTKGTDEEFEEWLDNYRKEEVTLN